MRISRVLSCLLETCRAFGCARHFLLKGLFVPAQNEVRNALFWAGEWRRHTAA